MAISSIQFSKRVVDFWLTFSTLQSISILGLDIRSSPYGLAAVLSHKVDDGTKYPISFALRSLAPAEKQFRLSFSQLNDFTIICSEELFLFCWNTNCFKAFTKKPKCGGSHFTSLSQLDTVSSQRRQVLCLKSAKALRLQPPEVILALWQVM